MTSKTNPSRRRVVRSALALGKDVRRGPTTADGREKWYISVDGQQRTVSTSVTSSQAMNEAMDLYSDALKRLAKR